MKFKKCCLGRPDDLMSVEAQEGEIMLVIETPKGVMQRIVPNASPLPSDGEQGHAAEAATHDAAAIWGMPDFVFLPQIDPTDSGKATRELGDGILILRDVGVVLQVKSRVDPTGDGEKEARWIVKKSDKAATQGYGTVRRLLMRSPVQLTNLRSRAMEIDVEARRWMVVVIIDHAKPSEDCTPEIVDAKYPTVVLLRRDWQFLFDQLKSTHAVVEYLERVAGDDPVPLGDEPVRYYERAQDDAVAPPSTPAPKIVADGRLLSAPLLPLAPVAHTDRRAHLMVRNIFEDIAATRLQTSTELDRLRVLAELDRLPVGQRAEVGSFVLAAMDQVSAVDDGSVLWPLRTLRGVDGLTHLGFGACSKPWTDEIAWAFSSWVQLRHYDFIADSGNDEITTVAVVVTPRTDGVRPWDTSMSMISGPISFEPDELKLLPQVWPGGAGAVSAAQPFRM